VSLFALVRSGTHPETDREPLLDAALDSFIDFGIRRSSMSEIAKRARLSPATLYRRFAQKNDVVLAVGLREVRRFIAAVEAKIDHTAPAEEQIVELFIGFSNGLREHKLLRRLLATEPEIVLPYLTVNGGPVLDLGRDYLVEFISRLQDEGKLPGYDPTPVAEMLARVALSMALLPATAIPLGDSAAGREFVRAHITPIYRLPPVPLR
jgi:AcrR family transcriptional regulator